MTPPRTIRASNGRARSTARPSASRSSCAWCAPSSRVLAMCETYPAPTVYRLAPHCEDDTVPAPCPLVLDDPARVGLLGAELVANRLRARPGLRLLLPTGRTPEGMYAALRAQAAQDRLPTEHASVFQLDEYAGLDAGDPRSFAATLRLELGGMRFASLH